jgi:hypothetical protein
MPGPGNSRIPTLSTFAEIGRFCNPVTTTSTAVICNASLRSVIQELLENARTKAFNTGRKEGYNEGRYLANEDEEKGRDAALEEGKKLGRKEELENTKNAEERAYKNGWREGHETGLDEGKEEREVTGKLAYEKGRKAECEAWETRHGPDKCEERQTRLQKVNVDAGVQTESTTRETDTSTQTTSTSTVDAIMQTIPLDDATPNPQSPPAAMLPPKTPAQPPSTTPALSTTTTTTASPASIRPPAPRV